MGQTGTDGGRAPSLAGDLAALAPGWLALLAVDPTSAALFGLPVAALAVIARRRLWPDAVARGRIAVGALHPFVALSSAASIGLRSCGAIAPWLLAFAALAAVDRPRRLRGESTVRRFPLATGASLAALAAILAALLFENGAFRYPTEDFVKALAAPPAAPVWSGEAKQAALAAARGALEGRAPQPFGGSGDVCAAQAEEGVFVTLYDRRGRVGRGFAKGGATAMDDVAAAARRAARAGWGPAGGELRVQIDVPGERRSATTRPLFSWGAGLFRSADPALRSLDRLGRWLDLAAQAEIGVDGLAFRIEGRPEPVLVLPGDPIAEGTLTPRVVSNPVALAAIARRASRQATGDGGRIGRDLEGVGLFRTTSFVEGPDGEAVDLYRGNALLDGDLDRATLVERTALAVAWLARRVEPDGRFHYETFPPYRGRTRDYNLPRHAGAVYGLLAAHRAGRGERGLAAAGEAALPAALAALDYTDRNLAAPDPGAEGLLCFVDGRGGADSGSTALAAISVAELPPPGEVRDAALAARIRAASAGERIAGMTRCLLAMIDPEGAVFGSYRASRRARTVAKEPLYYPGEVALALATVHERTGDGAALAGARRIADRQLRLYRVPLALGFPLPGDHWMIQALAKLAAATGRSEYAELALLMARGYLREQHPPQAVPYPDYRGSYRRIFDVPRTTRAASRGEALGGALAAADLLGADPAPFERALLAGARHLAEQQYTAANSYFVPASMDVLGGIRMGLVDDHLRIDNNQHGLVAMLNALRAYDRLEARGGI